MSFSAEAIPSRFRYSTWPIVTAWFFVASMVLVAVPGINEPHYVCKAKSSFDPDWCSKDFFLQSGNAHAVYFLITGWFTQILPFSGVAVLGRLISTSLLATGWVRLGRQFRLTDRSVVLASLLFVGISLSGNFSGEWIVGGFESKVPSYGLALLACAAWISSTRRSCSKSSAIAGAWLGLSISLHPVVGTWFLIGIGMCESFKIVRIATKSTSEAHAEESPLLAEKLKTALTLFGVAALFSLPGLVPALKLLFDTPVSQEQKHLADFIQVFGRLKHHLDPSTFPPRVWIHSAILLSVVCACRFILRRSRLQGKTDTETPEVDQLSLNIWLNLGVMSLIIAAVGVAIGWHMGPAKDLSNWEIRAALLKFYPFRFFDALLPITAAFLTAGTIHQATLRIRKLDVLWKRPGRSAVCMCMLGVGILGVVITQRTEAPSIYTEQDFARWKAACEWFRKNTEANDLILTPRESFAFKWYAERAEYVCFKDCPQDAAGILEWNRRLAVIHNWSSDSYQDQSYSQQDLSALHEQTGVDYIVTRKLGPFETQPVYDDGTWRIYDCTETL